jgi:curved DNA-binding protein CbpA
MKDYYEILEVNIHASKEVINKAYKALAMKYHPDSNPVEKKQWAEEKFKEINEAFEILSNEEKRREYDKRLSAYLNQNKVNEEQIKNRYEEMEKQNNILRQQVQNMKNNNYGNSQKQNNAQNLNNNYQQTNTASQEEINRQIQNSVNKAYHDAYIQRLKDYGYKIKYKKTFKQQLRDFGINALTIIIVAGVLCALWQIPAIQNYIKSNEVVKIFLENR